MRENFLRRSIIVMVIGALLIFVSSPRAFAAETINLDDIQSFMSINSDTSQSTTTTEQSSGSGSTGASTSAETGTSTETGTTSSSTGSSSTSGTTSSSTGSGSTSGTNSVSSKSKDDNLPETGSNTEVIFTIGSIILVGIAVCAYKRANIKV